MIFKNEIKGKGKDIGVTWSSSDEIQKQRRRMRESATKRGSFQYVKEKSKN